VSHDLRTPLASIRGAATSLRDDDNLPADTRRELVRSICDEAVRLERLVSNLLDMTRLDSGAITLRRDWVPLDELVGSALTRLEERLTERRIDIALQPDLPLLFVDPVLFEQLLLNLLENALKHTPLTKPFGVNELLARMRVAQRHMHNAGAGQDAEPQSHDFGTLHVDLARREVTRSGAPVHLTPTEYKLLMLLIRHAGKVLTHKQILQEIWGPSYGAQSHYVRVQMAELRKKVEEDPARPRLLVTEPGVGYRLRDRAL